MVAKEAENEHSRHARLLVVESARPRIAKVMSLLQPMEDDNATTSSVSVEYIPCVATFDSYQDEQGKDIRYLISVNYHGPDATQKMGSSLAPFFDQDQALHDKTKKEAEEGKPQRNFGIIGAAMGVGIEDSADVERIQVFFKTLRGQERDPLPIKILEPNPEYETMHKETEAFKALDQQAKEEASSRMHTMGPGKMAKFSYDYSRALLEELLKENEPIAQTDEGEGEDNNTKTHSPAEQSTAPQPPPPPPAPRIIDPNKTSYACRKCRTILFGQDDFEDPPHLAQQHQFSARKKHHGGADGTASCQSYFLTDKGLDWMGDMSDTEGRFGCPKCQSKLGTWHWAGAQCSCGTWVTPAVQIPKSKVDQLQPSTGNIELPPGTVISPHISIPNSIDT